MSNGARSLMMRATNRSHMRHITLIRTLETSLNHRALSQSAHYHMAVKSKVDVNVTIEGRVQRSAQSLSLIHI